MYGKGVTYGIADVRAPGETINLGVKIYFQPNGSRNLETTADLY